MGWVVNATLLQFTSKKEPASFVQEAGWDPRLVWTGAGNLAPAGIDPRTVQSAVSR
jgi:hypothetical protein